MNIFEVIQEEILTDYECPEKKANYIVNQYENASESEKTVINELLITLTGWSYESLAKKCKG